MIAERDISVLLYPGNIDAAGMANRVMGLFDVGDRLKLVLDESTDIGGQNFIVEPGGTGETFYAPDGSTINVWRQYIFIVRDGTCKLTWEVEAPVYNDLLVKGTADNPGLAIFNAKWPIVSLFNSGSDNVEVEAFCYLLPDLSLNASFQGGQYATGRTE